MFQKAQRIKSTLKLALTAPSGGGKTMSALRLAKGLGGKIAVIDTENGSASLYSNRFEFDTVKIDAPYTIQKYIAALKTAEQAGYQILIIDSLSHAWAGEGGLLAKKEALDARGGNSYTNWGSITKEHEQFKSSLLNFNGHLICTMRSKQDYVMEINDKGKQAPRKVGLAPVQRDGIEYEFTTVFDIAMDHNAAISKDRTGLFDGQIFIITEETGTLLKNWLSEGIDQPAVKPHQTNTNDQSGALTETTRRTAIEPNKNPIAPNFGGPSTAQLKRMHAIAKEHGWTEENMKAYSVAALGVKSSKDLTRNQYDMICKTMETQEFGFAMAAIEPPGMGN